MRFVLLSMIVEESKRLIKSYSFYLDSCKEHIDIEESSFTKKPFTNFQEALDLKKLQSFLVK